MDPESSARVQALVKQERGRSVALRIHENLAAGRPPICCFFFQAEDGIRDHCVTGVRRVLFRSHAKADEHGGRAAEPGHGKKGEPVRGQAAGKKAEGPAWLTMTAFPGAPVYLDGSSAPFGVSRSEERRVGKEGGCRGVAVHVEKH